MASGGEVPGQTPPYLAGSEDLDQMKCQQCLELGDLREVTHMCVECDEYLCLSCFKTHRLPKPSRNHQLIDREQMFQGNIRASTRDTCAEKCSKHEDDVIKYYCIKHGVLGCTLCVTGDHKTCDGVQFIPSVAKELQQNHEYMKTMTHLKTSIDTLKTACENIEFSTTELEASCIEALKSIQEFRKQVDEALSKIETELIEKVQEIKSKCLDELAALREKNTAMLEELQSSLDKIDSLQYAQQNCCSYIEMMKTGEKLASMDSQMKEVEAKSCIERKVKFSANLATLDTLTNTDSFGFLSEDKNSKIIGATQVTGITVKADTDKETCGIRRLVVLQDGNGDDRLLLTDYCNSNIKTISINNGKVLAQLTLQSKPWGLAAISSNTLVVSLPDTKKLVFLNVGDNAINIDRTLEVAGRCWGVDYRNNKRAMSYCDPDKVQVLSMQGTVLHEIPAASFNTPLYLCFGQEESTLLVSNFNGNNVVSVKLDGAVLATYTESELQGPYQPVVDRNGTVYVCAYYSHNIHQISQDFEKTRIILSMTNVLISPIAICINEEKDRLYVGLSRSDTIKVYRIERETQ